MCRKKPSTFFRSSSLPNLFSVSRRVLPRSGLARPINVEVPGISPDGAENDSPVKVWVDFLSEDLHAQIEAELSQDPGAITFLDGHGVFCEPSAQSLVEVANDQFGFVSAASQADEAAPVVDVQSEVHDRLAALEDSLSQIRDVIAEIPRQLKQASTEPSVSILPEPSKTRKPALRKPALRKPADVRYPNLDPAVVASARAPGIPEDHLSKLSSLFSKQPPQMTDYTDLPRRSNPAKDVLSESEDEDQLNDDPDPLEGADSPTGAVERAVVQLTKLVANMSQKSKSSSGLEGILERSEPSGLESHSSSSSGGRSKAAAYQKLKNALTSKPEWLYSSVEDKLLEDFHSVRTALGTAAASATSRGWVEHRSKLGYCPATIRFAWVIAGIHDCLRAGETAQARARCALALAAIDQSSLDAGSWTLAQEFLLELPPPYAAFMNHRAPDPSEQIATRLADDRLIEILLWRLKDRDSFLESRKRLNQNAKPKTPPPNPTAKPGPKPKAKPKAKVSSQAEDYGGAEN